MILAILIEKAIYGRSGIKLIPLAPGLFLTIAPTLPNVSCFGGAQPRPLTNTHDMAKFALCFAVMTTGRCIDAQTIGKDEAIGTTLSIISAWGVDAVIRLAKVPADHLVNLGNNIQQEATGSAASLLTTFFLGLFTYKV